MRIILYKRWWIILVKKIYACEMNCDSCPYTGPVDCSDAKKIENGRIIN
jgi:hypothetical protein